jgi:multicomponent Na+:H+ antiporter subunit A
LSAPLVIFAFTGLLSVGIAFLRGRIRLAAVLSASGSALAGLFALLARLEQPMTLLGMSIKIGNSWSLLGRAFVLDETNRVAVAFLFVMAAAGFAGGGVARPGRYFFSVGLVCVAMVSACLMIRPFLYAAILVELTAMGSVWLLATRDPDSRTAVQRLLALITVGMMALLVAGWLVEAAGVAAGAPETALQASLVLALGLAVLLGVPPFHHWIPKAASGSHPYGFTLIALLLQSAGLFLLLRFLDSYEWLRESEVLFGGIRLAGIATVIVAAAWGVTQRSFSQVVAYVLVADLGATLLAVSLRNPLGYQLALIMIGTRALGLGLWGLGRSGFVSVPGGGPRGARSQGGPLWDVAQFVGLGSLIGLPLTAGFPARWALMRGLAVEDLSGAIVLAVGMGTLLVAVARWIGEYFREEPAEAPHRSLVGRSVVAGAVGLCLVVGLFPRVLELLVGLGGGLRNLIP